MFFKKTTASVLAGFHRVLADLREVEQNHSIEAEGHRLAAEASKIAHEAATIEAAAARSVAGRIEALLGGDEFKPVLDNIVKADGYSVDAVLNEGIGGA